MVSVEEKQAAEELVEFIATCPSMFHTATTACERLEAAGFVRLAESEAWQLEAGGRYYVERNGSSVIAFSLGERAANADAYHFQIAASHTDSPTFKLKAVPELDGPGGARRLAVEAYGGMLDYTWFDRPLSLAGRVLVRTGDGVESRLIAPDRDLALIPSVAIHLDRDQNKAFSPNRARDLFPLISAGELGAGDFEAYIAREAGTDASDVLGFDLFLVNRVPGRVWGAANEFVSSAKLDDLMCAFMSLRAFLSAKNDDAITVWCCFDNEEVGSGTKQGAMSTFLPDVLTRLTAALGLGVDDYRRALAKSMLVSCDNAHAVHPNRPDLYDATNRCVMNGGIVIKEAANQHYCTDAFSRAVFVGLCERAGVPVQTYANRSDMAGGSTLGNLSNVQASMHAVDVGCAQLAMHSAYETAGVRDVMLAERALSAFYGADLHIDAAHAACW